MTSNVRAVLDTNVTVSAALLPRSTPRRAFDQALEQGAPLISLATLAELNEVLRRPRFNNYLREEERLEFLAALVRGCLKRRKLACGHEGEERGGWRNLGA